MIVTCNSLEEFVEELDSRVSSQGVGSVFQGLVRCSKAEVPVDADHVKRLVGLKISAVIAAEEGEYLLQCGLECGCDFHDAEPDTTGSEKAEQLRSKLEKACCRLGLKLGPGVISI